MKRMPFIFLVFLFSIGLGVYLQRDPGYIFIAIHHWTIETSLSVALIVLLFCFMVLYISVVLLRSIYLLPTKWQERQIKYRQHHAQSKTHQGLIEFSEGHWLKAKNDLIKALPGTDAPLLNYLTAARAAQEMGDSKCRDDYLREAQQRVPDAKIAVELTQAQLQLAHRQWEQALATLCHLQDLVPQHPYVLKLLIQLYKEVKDWPKLIALLPTLKRHHILTTPAYTQLEQEAYLEDLREHIKQNNSETIHQNKRALPKKIAKNPLIIAEYSRYLLKTQHDAEAEQLLRSYLRKKVDERLIELYGLVRHNEHALNFAESLLTKEPHSAILYLCLGRLSLGLQHWGKAKLYLEKSIAICATPHAYAALGQLLDQQNDLVHAHENYRKGLLLALE